MICCRVNPKQKAEVVRLIKNNLKKITLSVGDGANDVNMIQEAHIGIGIYGKEGMRAVQASDFAIGEFQCLWRLLLIHGRWCYKRNSLMIIYFFYKNMIFTIPHFFFSFLCASSGQTIFDDWYISFYNLFFTALPLIMRAVFEQDVDYKVRKPEERSSQCTTQLSAKGEGENTKKKQKKTHILVQDQYLRSQIPKLYYVGQNKTIFTASRFAGWVLWAMFQSLILFGVNYYVFTEVILDQNGTNGDMWSFSITYFTTIILLVDIKLAINTSYWIFLHWIAFIPLSVMLYVAYFFVSNYLSSTWAYMTPLMLIRVMHFYLTVALGLFTFSLVDYLIFTIPKLLFSNLEHTLVDYSKKLAYRRVSESPQNNASQDRDSLMQSIKHEELEEKIQGEVELSLQKHISLEKRPTINQFNIHKVVS